MITALRIISASEIFAIKPDFTYEWAENNRHTFYDLLESLGMNTEQPIDYQKDVQHRNMFNKIVVCDRWVGSERTDRDWINSGYASQEARDKAQGNKLIEDLYRTKGHY